MQNSVIKNTVSINQAIELCAEKNLVFAAYRLPNQQQSEIVVQASNKIRRVSSTDSHFDLKGFLVAPFSESKQTPSFIITPDIYAVGNLSAEDFDKIEDFDTQPYQSDSSHIPAEITHDDYLVQLSSIIEKIKEGTFEKVVPSRVKIVKGQCTSQLAELYSDLVEEYPNAFVYMFNAGPHLWVGATPEPLLRTTNGTMYTVSLAGTRPYNDKNLNIGAWNSKERLEQEYVTRYISKVLSKFNLLDVELEGPYTKRAGNLVHLRTDFSFRAVELKYCLGDFLASLHPTPAVCGMPRKESLNLIQGIEKHQREYYAGFLGPVGLSDRISIFVNLRCMKVLQEHLALFIGGGITADSVPEEEWHETEIKAETLLSVIRNLKK